MSPFSSAPPFQELNFFFYTYQLKLPYAECIGELGAIDPGRLGVMDLRPDGIL